MIARKEQAVAPTDTVALRGRPEQQQELARDERFVLWRVRRERDGDSVLLKRPHGAQASPAEIALLEREFELLRSLPIEAVTRPLALLREGLHVGLVLEDHGGRTLAALLHEGRPPLGWVLDYASQLATLLADLHRGGVVHLGIRPQAVLVEGPAQRIRLTDFSTAARAAAEVAEPLPPSLYGSRLAYAAPEYTGRVGRVSDYRSDYYALGVLLYELLCGRAPFTSVDPLELIHAHVAVVPVAPAEIDAAVPLVVSQIVLKLLAKAPEDRYQSAGSLQRDLQRCRQEWSRHGRVLPFPIGQRDMPEAFAVPRRLYGRQPELARLHAAFDSARQGRARILLVAGSAGVGKTTLIQGLREPAARAQGALVSGKFDQLSGDAPYRALSQALRQQMQRLLAQPAPRLARQRRQLADALGDTATAIAALIPELALVLGPLPTDPALPPLEAQNRLVLAFQRFVACLAGADSPLIIFLDDLQWADAASLAMIEALFAGPALHHLLLVGAYRDNEADARHPLLATMATLHEAGVPIERIELAPLELSALTQLAADTLRVTPAAAEPMAALLLQKTAGNPFFTTQFLMSLHREGLITFDADHSSWRCDLDRIAAAATTDNVADLMSSKIDRLAPVTQRVLTLAACIGHRFDAHTLAVVSEQSLEATRSDLAEAALEGLIVAETEDVYVFLHDRVQQAAYARIAAPRRPQVHLSVGRLLLDRRPAAPADAALFDIVSHLNLGAPLIHERAERLALARLNLDAGIEAKRASAFRSALAYLTAGIGMLDEQHWRSHYELAFALWFEAAQCEYLCGAFDRARLACATLLQHAVSARDKARVHGLRMVQFENMARYADALASGREGLSLLGVVLPEEAAHKEAALAREVATIEAHTTGRPIAALVDLPVMDDPDLRMVMSLLTDAWSSAYILGDATLARLISATLVRLSLADGNCEESAYGYVTHAITVGPVRGDYEAAFEYGTLALRVNERFDDRRRRAKIQQQFHAHVNLWCRPMQSCIAYAKEACRSGLASGDFLYAAYGASTESWPAIVSCDNLAECVRGLAPNLALVVQLKNTPFADALRLVMSWALALQGRTKAPLSLSHAEGDGFDEATYARTYSANPFFTMFHAIARLHLGVVLDAPQEALAAADSVRESAHQLTGMIWSVLYEFWGSLAYAANFERAADDAQRAAWLDQMHAAKATLATLARSCAPNFLCYSLLLDAELERLAGRQDAALDRFERALTYADEIADVQQQALANELFAKFWLGRGNRGIATLYLRAALAHYAAWGAQAKVRRMLERHADLLAPLAAAAQPAMPAATLDSLDLATIVKAAHAIAESIDLETLLERLLRIAIENAGARRGLLIEENDATLAIVAEGTRDGVTLLHDVSLPDDPPRCSRAVVDYVWRTRASLVIADATQDERFAHDAYVMAVRPRSILCLPIVHQGQVSALVYLENELARDAFAPQRIEALQVLMAQGSFSLANARLAHRMRQEMTERQRAEDTLRAIEAGTASVVGADFFRALVRNLAHALHVRYAFVAECSTVEGSGRAMARSRAFWNDDDFGVDFAYEIPGTPCEAVLAGQTCHHADDVCSLFPGDAGLVALNARSYLGIPLLGSNGEVIGHMAVLDTRPLRDASVAMSVMRLSAGRAGAELERLKAAEGLQRALDEVQLLKNRLQEENVYLRRELIANVSHDLRSPLASLRGYLETLLLKEGTLTAAERRTYLDIALRQAQHLQGLIAELFELARLDFEGYRIDPEPLQLGELASDVMQKLGLAARDRCVTLAAEIEPGLGMVRSDIGLLERALTNLLDNALAHTPTGGRIVLSVRSHGAGIELRVSDNGSGIPPADLPHIFERFYRVDKARSRDTKGSGLGLAIVKRIIELHGSEIRVASELDRGTSFWFELPLA